MTNDELAALRAEADRLWLILSGEEKKYQAHVNAWADASALARAAEQELEVERRVAERLAQKEAA